jgi:SAM-dependent methyltransferase
MFITNCRMCDSTNLYKFLDLGSMPPADQFWFASKIQHEQKFPLEVMSCQTCGLAQLSYVVPGGILYCDDYPYEASTTAMARAHWKEFAQSVWDKLPVATEDLVVDVGSNVGVLLQAFKDEGARVVGIDPASNMAKVANGSGIQTVEGFFNEALAGAIVCEYGQASIITGTNVFAHIPDLEEFMRAVWVLLKPKGSLIIESPHFMALVRDSLYDTIYHEHLSYLSVKPLVKFFTRYGMEIYDIQRQSNHGESFRYFVRWKSYEPSSDVVTQILDEEEKAGIYNNATLDRFAFKVLECKEELRNLVLDLKKQGKRIAAVSAPAKGMTLLNYCGLGVDLIDFTTEKAKLKIGRVTPGTHIPVVCDDVLLKEQPDYALLLAWNFADEIIKNLYQFSGKFIIPIPVPRII